MNNNQLTEKALRNVFETSSYINIGTVDAPLEYNVKSPARPCCVGKQFITNPGKLGKTVDVYFQKDHPWIFDGDGFTDHLTYKDVQEQRFKGFLDSDFSRRDEFSNMLRTSQYREQLKMEEKHARQSLEFLAKKVAEIDKCQLEVAHSTRFNGPKYLYDVGKTGLACTPHCNKCHKETYYCPHRAAYSTNNVDIEKEKGGYRCTSNEIGRTPKVFNYSKPQHARKTTIKDTFYRRQSIFYPSKTRTNFINQAELN